MTAPHRERTPQPELRSSMFGGFAAAKRSKAPPWAGPLLIGAVAAHILLFGGMWIKSMWDIERLDPLKVSIDLVSGPQLPSAAPAPRGGSKPVEKKVIEKKVTAHDLTNITKPPPKQQPQTTATTTDDSNPGGAGGSGDPSSTGDCIGPACGPPEPAAPPPPPPPPPPAPPQTVQPTLLEALRDRGEKNILPDEPTALEISRSGKTKVVATFKLCISTAGNITAVNQLKSSGFPAYDGKIQREMRTWHYRPYTMDGKPVVACTAVTFIYSQQ